MVEFKLVCNGKETEEYFGNGEKIANYFLDKDFDIAGYLYDISDDGVATLIIIGYDEDAAIRIMNDFDTNLYALLRLAGFTISMIGFRSMSDEEEKDFYRNK